MGLFDRFRKALGGSKQEAADKGIYLYIKLDHSGEIVRLRLNPAWELNRDYESGEYVCHKLIVGPRSYRRADATFRFDASRQLTECDITGGELSTEDAWLSQQQGGLGL